MFMWTALTSKAWLCPVISLHGSLFLIFYLLFFPRIKVTVAVKPSSEMRALSSSFLNEMVIHTFFKKKIFFVGMWCFSFKSLFLFCLSLPSVLFHTWDFSILILHSLSWHHCLVFQLNVLGVFSCSENNPLNECCELSVISLVASGHEWCQHLSMRSILCLWYEAENLQWRQEWTQRTKQNILHSWFPMIHGV